MYNQFQLAGYTQQCTSCGKSAQAEMRTSPFPSLHACIQRHSNSSHEPEIQLSGYQKASSLCWSTLSHITTEIWLRVLLKPKGTLSWKQPPGSGKGFLVSKHYDTYLLHIDKLCKLTSSHCDWMQYDCDWVEAYQAFNPRHKSYLQCNKLGKKELRFPCAY
jgi:hypothetical protein